MTGGVIVADMHPNFFFFFFLDISTLNMNNIADLMP